MYRDSTGWQQIQPHLPAHNQLTANTLPAESYLPLGDIELHLDTYQPAEVTTNSTVIMLHGVGGNGRLLSFMAVPLLKAGCKVICPDLPGYGFTHFKRPVNYSTWLDCAQALIEQELQQQRKVFVFGLSAGGMLAYNACCRCPDVAGLIVTNILDNRLPIVRRYSAKNSFQATAGTKLLQWMPNMVQRQRIPIRWVTNMNGLVNHPQVLEALLSDARGAGGMVSIEFLLTMLNYPPELEPEHFPTPTLLCHPADDRWTPTEISELYFDRIGSATEKVLLDNCGHFPIEAPGLQQLERKILMFLSANGP